MKSKELLENLINVLWNNPEHKDQQYVVELKEWVREGETVPGNGIIMVHIIVTLKWKNNLIYKQEQIFQKINSKSTLQYKDQLETYTEYCYNTMLNNMLLNGLNSSIKDWESGRIERVGDQLKFNPTTDEILAKLGIKIISIK